MLLCSFSVAEALDYRINTKIHGVDFSGNVATPSENPTFTTDEVPDYCESGESYAYAKVRIYQNELLEYQLGYIRYAVPAWVRFPDEESLVVCLGFVNTVLQFDKIDGVYVQTAASETETISEGRVYPQ